MPERSTSSRPGRRRSFATMRPTPGCSASSAGRSSPGGRRGPHDRARELHAARGLRAGGGGPPPAGGGGGVSETYLDEAVDGLEIGAPVKYRGVQVGSVIQIGLAQEIYEIPPTEERFYKEGRYVVVRARLRATGELEAERRRIESRVPRELEAGLRFRPSSNPITGTSFLELDYVDAARSPELPFSWTPEHPYLPSTPSTIARLGSAPPPDVPPASPPSPWGGWSGACAGRSTRQTRRFPRPSSASSRTRRAARWWTCGRRAAACAAPSGAWTWERSRGGWTQRSIRSRAWRAA